VLPCGPARGGECSCNGSCDAASPTSAEERCFLLGPLRGCITRPDELSSVSGVESSYIESSAGCSEMGDTQRGLEAVNTETEGSTALKVVTRQPVNTEQTEKTLYVLHSTEGCVN
jgi:hypothetical protein